MTERLYWLGNSAKSRVIREILTDEARSGQTIVFDYGCGDGGDWPAILTDHPWLRLVGYEPFAPSRRKARERLEGLAADILGGRRGIAELQLQADHIVSFSVFEHVVDRAGFLRNAKRLLAPDGLFHLNYDDGHFRNQMDISRPGTWLPAARTWWRTMISRPLAALGGSARYQRRVYAGEADRLIAKSGFLVERVDYHNMICLKELAKSMPEEMRQRYAAWWLETEMHLNEHFMVRLQEARYGDNINLWRSMASRTMRLRHFESGEARRMMPRGIT